MRCPLEQVQGCTRPWCKSTNSFQISEERRKLSMTIAHAMEALPATRSLSQCCLDSDVSRVGCLDTKYEGKHRFWQRFVQDFSVPGNSSISCSMSLTPHETPTSLRAKATNVDHVGNSVTPHPALRAGNRTGRWTGITSHGSSRDS